MICGAILARNEAAPDRYLARVLQNVASFCDHTLLLDDGSTDDTAAIAAAAGAEVVALNEAGGSGWWGWEAAWTPATEGGNLPAKRGNQQGNAGESPARAALWSLAADRAGPDGWVYIADADHELVGIRPEEFRALTGSTLVNCWAFPLYDCWNSDREMRSDGYWQAHVNPRVWLAKAMPHEGFVAEWSDRSIHTGHLPANYPVFAGLAPPPAGIRHLGYVKPVHRIRKMQQYLALAE